MFVGEIGIPRKEFLYDIRFWEAYRIIKGYNRRHRNIWSAIRWQTYQVMRAQVGDDNLKKARIYNPSDLMQFPWDKEPAPPISDADRNELMAEMAAINAQRKSTET